LIDLIARREYLFRPGAEEPLGGRSILR